MTLESFLGHFFQLQFLTFCPFCNRVTKLEQKQETQSWKRKENSIGPCFYHIVAGWIKVLAWFPCATAKCRQRIHVWKILKQICLIRNCDFLKSHSHWTRICSYVGGNQLHRNEQQFVQFSARIANYCLVWIGLEFSCLCQLRRSDWLSGSPVG